MMHSILLTCSGTAAHGTPVQATPGLLLRHLQRTCYSHSGQAERAVALWHLLGGGGNGSRPHPSRRGPALILRRHHPLAGRIATTGALRALPNSTKDAKRTKTARRCNMGLSFVAGFIVQASLPAKQLSVLLGWGRRA